MIVSTKKIRILLLTWCLAFQGLVFLHSISFPGALLNAPATEKSTQLTQVLPADFADCCHMHQFEDEIDKEKNAEWKFDIHDASSHPLLLTASAALKFPPNEEDNYPSPSYPFHRPPNSLS